MHPSSLGEAYDTELRAFSQELFQQWLADHTAPGRRPQLYHYTTSQGLLGIWHADGRMWATNTAYLNDRSERIYGTELLAQILNGVSCNSKAEDKLLECIKNAFGAFDRETELYAVCFCQNSSVLSQWRAYGAQGGGYALGILALGPDQETSPESFATPPIGGQQRADFVLRKINYCRDEQLATINNTMKSILARFTEMLPCGAREVEAHVGQFCHLATRRLSEFLLCFKHEAFYEEQEWRAVAVKNIPDEEFVPKFRDRGPDIVPYIELQLGAVMRTGLSFGVNSIVCGPTARGALNVKAVGRLVAHQRPDFCPSNVSIERSTIPFENF